MSVCIKLHGLFEGGICGRFHLLRNSLLKIRNQFLYPLLNLFYGLLLFHWERTAETDVGTLLIDLNELLSCKLAFIRYQARPDCKVSFGTYIIPFVIMAWFRPV